MEVITLYTIEEEKEFNNQLKKWQNKQLRAVRRKNFDNASEKMHDADRSVWEIIAKAKSHKDVSPFVWDHAERIIDKYYKLAR